jgi:hypothetical protein
MVCLIITIENRTLLINEICNIHFLRYFVGEHPAMSQDDVQVDEVGADRRSLTHMLWITTYV